MNEISIKLMGKYLARIRILFLPAAAAIYINLGKITNLQILIDRSYTSSG
jgi:hypothetical protein